MIAQRGPLPIIPIEFLPDADEFRHTAIDVENPIDSTLDTVTRCVEQASRMLIHQDARSLNLWHGMCLHISIR